MARIQVWTEEEATLNLKKRLRASMDARKTFEQFWKSNESTVFGTGINSGSNLKQRSSGYYDSNGESPNNSARDVNISYAFKNIRFIHAQMSANPPSATARPNSSDPSDREKADAADRVIRHAIRAYSLQEYIDDASLKCLVYGTGFIKTLWNPHDGDILDINEESGEIINEGRINIKVPSTWNMYVDPDADCWSDVRYVFERLIMPYEEACYLFPDKKEILKKLRQEVYTSSTDGTDDNSFLQKDKYDVVELYEYWELGTPMNGYLGRYAVCTGDGQIVESVRPNPFRFRPGGDEEAKYEKAQLPYTILTDIDVPEHIWGKSILDYITPIQDTLNRLDSINLDNVQAHGVTRLVLPESADIADDGLTNSPWDVVKITGAQPPFYVQAPQTMPQVDQLREQHRVGIDDMAGVNESMMGQQSREQATSTMQYATQQGNMIRRRLFNKYAIFVETTYKNFLDLVRKHWDTSRIIRVIGTEKALESVELKGADIDGGYDIVVEYGQSLSLDPLTRREELITLQPLFEKAGVPPRVSLKMMKLNELEGLYDMMALSESRQREIFEEMVAEKVYIEPEEFEDHPNMLAYALQFVMTTEFKYLEPELKELIRQHIRDRSALAAQEVAPPGMSGVEGAQAGGPMSPGPNVAGVGDLQAPAPIGPIEGEGV